MDKLINELEAVIEKKADNNELRLELASLVKMLKTGFESKPVAMEKIPKVFASNDTTKIKAFYDAFGSQINALKLSGNFDEFVSYININYGIAISYESDPAPNLHYIQKPKKLAKFKDLYESYFFETVPKNASDAVTKILNSLDKLNKEYYNENEVVKEALKAVIEAQPTYDAETIKTVDRILTKARLKSIDIQEVATDIEIKVSHQLDGINIIQGQKNEEK